MKMKVCWVCLLENLPDTDDSKVYSLILGGLKDDGAFISGQKAPSSHFPHVFVAASRPTEGKHNPLK